MPPLTLARRVARTITRRALFAPGERIAVALSGGADSVALTLVLRELESRARWSVIGLIHVNHGLRGVESDVDEAFCRDLAARLTLPIDVARPDVSARARAARRSLEATARDARYECFSRAAATLGATAVATAHTADDQAETVLLRLLRGAGNRGVGAIRPRRDIYARPFIDASRLDVRTYLQERGETFREDRSNEDQSIPRNRLRHHLVPQIVADWPGAVRALARFAELAADDERFLTATAAQIAPAVTFSRPGGVELDVRGLGELPPAIARRVIRDVVEQAGGTVALADIEAIRRLVAGRRSRARLDLAGIVVERQDWGLRCLPASREVVAPFEYVLPVPGAVKIHETDCTVTASMREGDSRPASGSGDRRVAVVQADCVTLPFSVRSRRPGDRFRPFGSPGRRKLQDLLVDRKVPRQERDRVPVVVDGSGRIVWVGGVEIAEECRVTRPESGMVILTLEKGT